MRVLPKGQKLPKTLFEFRKQLAQKFYENDVDDVKHEVEKHCLVMKAGKMASDTNNKNGGMQIYVLFLTRFPSCY